MHQQVDHKEWLKKCYLYRQQIGARLEVLASLADKQIAQEDAKGQATNKTAPMASRASVNAPPAAPSPFPTTRVPATNSIQPQSTGAFHLSIYDVSG
jgi:hypothetical protein